jgi:hypothetical protein
VFKHFKAEVLLKEAGEVPTRAGTHKWDSSGVLDVIHFRCDGGYDVGRVLAERQAVGEVGAAASQQA